MNWIIAMIALGLVAASGLTGCVEEKIPVGTAYPAVDVSQMLGVYARLTGKTVDVPNEVRAVPVPIYLNQTRPLTKAEAIKLIEQDLGEQADVIILHQDRQHVVFGLPFRSRRWLSFLL